MSKEEQSRTITRPKRKRQEFEILAISLHCEDQVSEEIEITYTLRYRGITVHNLRELVHFYGTWPDESAEDVGALVFKDRNATPDEEGEKRIGVTFSDRQYASIRGHLNVWILRLYARLLQVVQPETEYTEAVIREAKVAAKAFGYDWEDSDK
jgi:hypothetical protein